MRSILVFFLLFTSTLAYSQDTEYKVLKRTKKFVREVSNIIKSNSLFSDSLNWNQINDDLALLPLGKDDSTDHQVIFDFFTKKLRNAGDKHSFFITQAKKNLYISKNSEPKQPEGEYLGNGIGLIKVPSCLTFNNIKDRNFANNIRYQIKKLDTENEINNWVIDLRANGGGNMWPMLAGLNALTNDGIVGYLVGTKNKKEVIWKTENGKIGFSREIIDPYKVKNLPAKIAVLIDSLTGSSGEMTAISFMGPANVKIFGQPSAGYTTANSTIYLSDGTQLYLATNFVADRTHKSYPGKIIPDVIINTQSSFSNDETLEHSKKWLLQTDKK